LAARSNLLLSATAIFRSTRTELMRMADLASAIFFNAGDLLASLALN
jgi:hypothetical protein